MGKPRAPQPPDPAKTASAQGQINLQTAVAQQQLSNINQVTPDGNLTFSQTGTFKSTDPLTGKVTDVPTSTATQTLSPEQEAIKTQTDAAELNLAGTAANQSSFLKDFLGKRVDLNNEATEARLFELGRKRLDPALAERRQRSEQNLADRGLKFGSDDFDRGIEQVTQGENDAYNQLLLGGRGQAVQETLTERNQPINEIIGLLSGSQVQQPNFVNTQPPQLANVDFAGLTQDNFNSQLGIFNQRNKQRQNVLGGLFGLGSSLIGLSDRREKKDINKVGKVDGLGIYKYRYKSESKKAPLHLGLMAQEVEKSRPEAVIESGGRKFVDYGKALEVT